MSAVYHLALSGDDTEEARLALLPGDPDRVPRLAGRLDPACRRLTHKREYHSYLSRVSGSPVLVTSTGIGGPSTSIAVEELAQLGVRTFLRVGTTGAIASGLEVGDVVITSGAVRLDGASTHYAPIEYPAIAHHEVVRTLVDAAVEVGARFRVGITASSATFYPGEERADSFGGYVLRRFRGSTEEWRRLHVLNYEMEAATLLTMCAALGLRAGCVTGVVNPGGGEIGQEALERGEESAIAVAAAAVRRLVSQGAKTDSARHAADGG